MFIVLTLSTQSGNFWIYPRTLDNVEPRNSTEVVG